MKLYRIKTVFIVLIMSTFMLSACTRKIDTQSGEKGETSLQSQTNLGEAADFTLENINGQKITLQEELKTRNAVLVFFATWCPYCVKEIPGVNDFYTKNKAKVAVMGINIQESKTKVANFIKNKGVIYPVVLDTDGRVAGLYGIRGIPAVIAIDKGGKILYNGHSIEEVKKKVKF